MDKKRIFAFTEHAALLRNQETKLKTNSLEYREPNFESWTFPERTPCLKQLRGSCVEKYSNKTVKIFCIVLDDITEGKSWNFVLSLMLFCKYS